MTDGRVHTPVLYDEILDCLKLESKMTVVDGTLGGAGHAEGIIKKILPDGKLIGIDKDDAAIKRGSARLEPYKSNLVLVNDDFKNIKSVLEHLNISDIDAVLLDLGVSSYQLDEADRGFSYHQEASLDMRMDKSQSLSAYEIVNSYSEKKLARIIADYGEERWAVRIAKFIVSERKKNDIRTTLELVEIIKQAIPAAVRRSGPHPARRTFQAIRIETNAELSNLGQAIKDYVHVLKKGGRIAVISFHSLEDRIVKHTFRDLQSPCTCPKEFPVCMCDKESTLKVVTRRPIYPSDAEIKQNPRARSARLRVAEKSI